MLFIFSAWQWLAGGASKLWRTVTASKPLTYAALGIVGALALIFGYRRAIAKAKKMGAEEREEEIFDKIERDTKDAIRKIEEAERKHEAAAGPPPVFEDRGDGEGLTTDDLNSRELERLRERADDDPRNRKNPRSTPRLDV